MPAEMSRVASIDISGFGAWTADPSKPESHAVRKVNLGKKDRALSAQKGQESHVALKGLCLSFAVGLQWAWQQGRAGELCSALFTSSWVSCCSAQTSKSIKAAYCRCVQLWEDMPRSAAFDVDMDKRQTLLRSLSPCLLLPGRV